MIPIADAHIHIGKFREKYFKPDTIAKELIRMRVENWLVSSTTGVTGKWEKAEEEIQCMLDAAPYKSLPLLWLTPGMVERSFDLSLYFRRIDYVGLKIHGFGNNWPPYGKKLRQIFHVAKERKLVIMLHTGGCDRCDACVYEKIIAEFPMVTVILAHGRPLDQTIHLLAKYERTFADTAFMPTDHLAKIAKANLLHKIVFGSDYPIISCFRHKIPLKNLYISNVKSIQRYIDTSSEKFMSILKGSI